MLNWSQPGNLGKEKLVTEASASQTPPVVAHDESPSLSEPAKKSPKKTPKWESEARDMLKAAIRRFNKPLSAMLERDENEGNTRLLFTDFLCEGLGFDKYSDLTTEYQVKGEFADNGIRVVKELVAFIESKRVATACHQTSPPSTDLCSERGY